MLRRKIVLLVAGIVAVGLVAGQAGAAKPQSSTAAPAKMTTLLPNVGMVGSTSTTVTRVFSTATNEINCGFMEGWWSTNTASSDCNSNYETGVSESGVVVHGYSTFYLSGWPNPCGILSAYLSVNSGEGNQAGYGQGDGTQSLGLFDVATDPLTLSEKDNNPNSTIYSDLGSGAMYGGPYTVSTYDNNVTEQLFLNQTGLNGLLAARNQGYFSIGMGLINPTAGNYQFLFGFTGAHPITLTVTQPRLCKVS